MRRPPGPTSSTGALGSSQPSRPPHRWAERSSSPESGGSAPPAGGRLDPCIGARPSFHIQLSAAPSRKANRMPHGPKPSRGLGDLDLSELDHVASQADTPRFWNALAGGKDNLAVERELAATALHYAPDFGAMVAAIRSFHLRAGEELARAGVSQFIDFLPGYWDDRGTQDAVQQVNPEARVMFVDRNPRVVARARALYEVNQWTHTLNADPFDPAAVTSHPEATDFLDWTQPIAMLHSVTFLQYPGTTADAAKLLQSYVDAIPAGSYTASTHWQMPAPGPTAGVAEHLTHVLGGETPLGSYRPRDEILDILTGQDLIDPGLVPCGEWRNPDLNEPSARSTTEDLFEPGWPLKYAMAAVGRTS